MRKKDQMKPLGLALTAAPLIALSVAACGTASSTQPSKAAASAPVTVAAASASPTAAAAAQFAAAADRICAVQNQRETALGPGLINADIVPVTRLPKAAAYLEKVIAIKNYGLPALRQLAAAGPAADQAAREAYVRDFQKVTADYQDAARAARAGNQRAFRADFDKVAPHGYPTGPDQVALDHATTVFPFKACGKFPGL
jgi:hypothetical protein